jgi:hypothetical protein
MKCEAKRSDSVTVNIIIRNNNFELTEIASFLTLRTDKSHHSNYTSLNYSLTHCFLKNKGGNIRGTTKPS